MNGTKDISCEPGRPSFEKYQNNLPVAFMHIPKTAGTSLTLGLHQVLQPKVSAHGLGGHIFGPFDKFETMPEGRRNMIFLTPDSLPADADLVGGHITLSTLRARYPYAQLITVLREPISRLLSQWLFWRSWPWPGEDFWGAWGQMINHSRRTLHDFLCDWDVATTTDNVCLRMLLEPRQGLAIDEFIDPSDDDRLFTSAIRELKTFAHVDIVENPRFEDNLSDWLGKPFPTIRANQMPIMPHEVTCRLEDELNDQTLAVLRTRTRLDLRLWEYVAEWHGLNHQEMRVDALIKNMSRYTLAARGDQPT